MPVVASERMVGRRAELGILRDGLHDGRRGVPRLIVVRGEAGIGKSRLVQESLKVTEANSDEATAVLVAFGHCVDFGDIGSPFASIRHLLAELYEAVGDQEFRSAAGTPAVVATLGTLLPELASDAPALSSFAADAVAEAIERVLRHLSAAYHLVLVIEDLHWADASTIRLLRTLAVTLQATHVTLVVTYRTDDLPRGSPLRSLLSEFDRTRAVTVVELKRLNDEEVAEQARLIRADIDDHQLRSIFRRSDGVPFFVEELLQSLDEPIPGSLRDVVLGRYERLPPEVRRTIDAVSAGGERVDESVLEDLLNASPTASLKEAVAAGVLAADDAGISFRHALIREAVHDNLLPSERLVLHRRYARVLQARAASGEDRLHTEIAEHWLRAGDLVPAFEATVEARRHAIATFAPAAAAAMGERLLELWVKVPDPEGRCRESSTQLAESVAWNWYYLGNADAVARVAEAQIAAMGDEDPVGQAALHRLCAATWFNDGRLADGRRHLQECLALLEPVQAPRRNALLGRALSIDLLLGHAALGDVEFDDAVHRTLELTRGAHSEPLALIHTNLAWAMADRGRFAEALEAVREPDGWDIPPAERLPGRTVEVSILNGLGRRAEAADVATTALRSAQTLGVEQGFGAIFVAQAITALLAVGRLESARALLPDARRLVRSRGNGRRRWREWMLLTDLFEAEEAAGPEVVGGDRSDVFETTQLVADAELRIHATMNRLDGASDPAERKAATLEAVRAAQLIAGAEVTRIPGVLRWVLPSAARVVAEAATARLPGPEHIELRRAVMSLVEQQPGDPAGDAVAAVVAAELARADGRAPEDLVVLWHDAAERMTDVATAHLTQYTRCRLGEALLFAGRRDEASGILRAVIINATRSGVSAVGRSAWRIAVRARLLAAGPDGIPRSSPMSALTAREREILQLVAEGLSNGQIGKRLFISPKTASVHVSAILSKTGALNRTEAAAVFVAER